MAHMTHNMPQTRSTHSAHGPTTGATRRAPRPPTPAAASGPTHLLPRRFCWKCVLVCTRSCLHHGGRHATDTRRVSVRSQWTAGQGCRCAQDTCVQAGPDDVPAGPAAVGRPGSPRSLPAVPGCVAPRNTGLRREGGMGRGGQWTPGCRQPWPPRVWAPSRHSRGSGHTGATWAGHLGSAVLASGHPPWPVGDGGPQTDPWGPHWPSLSCALLDAFPQGPPQNLHPDVFLEEGTRPGGVLDQGDSQGPPGVR